MDNLQMGIPPEHPRASTSDDVECFFSVMRDNLGKNFTLKEVKYNFRKEFNCNNEDVTPDESISSEHLEQLKNGFYETKVRVTPQEIERKTQDQAENEDWINERRKSVMLEPLQK